MTKPTQTMRTPTSDQDHATNLPNRAMRWTIVATLLLAAGPLLYTAARREISKWYEAAALDATYNDDHTASLEKIQRALEWNPGSPSLAINQISAYLRLGQANRAAAASDAYLETVEKQYATLPTKPNEQNLAIALNQSAYSHALANTNLEEALENVERSIRLQGGDPASTIDTRGYLHYLLGNYEEAVKDTELAVDGFQKLLRRRKASENPDIQFFVDKTPIEHVEKSLNESLAVLLHHRGLAYKAVERNEEAEKDFEKAEELGYDPENGVW